MRPLHVSPALPVADVGDHRLAHPELLRDGLLCSGRAPDGSDLFGRELGGRMRETPAHTLRVRSGPMAISATCSGSPLGVAVSDVVEVRSEEEVIGANTGRVVAEVADGEPIGDRSVLEFPRNAVGAAQLATMLERSVPTSLEGSGRPLPASIGAARTIDLGREALSYGQGHGIGGGTRAPKSPIVAITKIASNNRRGAIDGRTFHRGHSSTVSTLAGGVT